MSGARLGAAVGFCAALFALTQHLHAWNFDALTYAAVAHRWAAPGADDTTVHQRVFADLNALAPPNDIAALTTTSAYRKGVFAEPSALAVASGFYSNKPLLNALMAMPVRAGVNAFSALFFVTGLAWALLCTLLLVAVWRAEHSAFVRFAAVVLVLSPASMEAALLGTPDSLVALTTFAGTWLLLRRRTATACVAFGLACLARPDAVILCGALLFWAGWQTRRFLPVALALGLAAGNVLSQHLLHARSWSALFINSFVARITTQEQVAAAAVDFPTWKAGVASSLRGDQVLFTSTWALFATASLVACRRPGARLLHLAIWTSFVVHVAIFPLLDDRYFLAHYVVIALLVLARAQVSQTALNKA